MSSSSTFHFFGLPYEIRIRILKFAFETPYGLVLLPTHGERPKTKCLDSNGFFCASRQALTEALEALYISNTIIYPWHCLPGGKWTPDLVFPQQLDDIMSKFRSIEIKLVMPSVYIPEDSRNLATPTGFLTILFEKLQKMRKGQKEPRKLNLSFRFTPTHPLWDEENIENFLHTQALTTYISQDDAEQQNMAMQHFIMSQLAHLLPQLQARFNSLPGVEYQDAAIIYDIEEKTRKKIVVGPHFKRKSETLVLFSVPGMTRRLLFSLENTRSTTFFPLSVIDDPEAIDIRLEIARDMAASRLM